MIPHSRLAGQIFFRAFASSRVASRMRAGRQLLPSPHVGEGTISRLPARRVTGIIRRARACRLAIARREMGQTLMDENILIRQAQEGDVSAFNRLVLAYQDRVYNAACRIMDDEAAAADAAQEAFIAAFQRLETYRGGSFKGWLLRIVTNACYDELRRRRRRPARSLEDMTPEDSLDPPPQLVSSEEEPEAHAQRMELGAGIEHCLRGLSAEHRALVVLRDIEDLDYQEIAAVTGLELGTVKSRLSRARGRLRDCLRRMGELLPLEYRLEDEL